MECPQRIGVRFISGARQRANLTLSIFWSYVAPNHAHANEPDAFVPFRAFRAALFFLDMYFSDLQI